MNESAIDLFKTAASKCSQIITQTYSTSFSLATRLLGKEIRQDIYNIYGFVRVADEIVDTFHDADKEDLLSSFQADTFMALRDRISMNPVLHGFQQTVNKYGIDTSLVRAFFRSMEMDLIYSEYDSQLLETYIYGSAEVVGLMCLHVFVGGDKNRVERLETSARALGAAFQKINFLRDLSVDVHMNRRYFQKLSCADGKNTIEQDIRNDLKIAFDGIRLLPGNSRLAVYTAYRFFELVLEKIKRRSLESLFEKRVRLSNPAKYITLLKALIANTTIKKQRVL